jgi:hypothetical protein
MNAQKITNVATPTATTDAANKAYVDAHPAGTVTGTGVASRVAFWSGTSSLSSDVNLYWDGTNDRLGIGTTSPNAKLHVRETANSTSAGYVLLVQSVNGGGDYFNTSGFYKDSSQNMQLKLTANSSSNSVFINSAGDSYLNGGDIGIGTTTPSAKLDVAGNIRLESANQIYFGGTGSIPYWYAGVDNTTNNNFVIGGSSYYSGDRDILLNPSNNGNVGIGTTSPKSKLDVNSVFCVDSKTHTITDAFTTCLTVNLTNHTGCHVVITAFGDWPSHSSAAYRGEFFLQNGANAYAEPGIILRQDDNTSTGTDQIICQIVDPTSTANPKDFAIQIRHTDTTSPASWTAQLTYTVQGKFNSIT